MLPLILLDARPRIHRLPVINSNRLREQLVVKAVVRTLAFQRALPAVLITADLRYVFLVGVGVAR